VGWQAGADGTIADVRARNAAVLALGLGIPAPALADEPPKTPASTGPAAAPAQAPASPNSTTTAAPAQAPANDPGAPTAAPKDAATTIAEARRAIEDQQYDEALALLSPLLASSSRGTRASALELTAVVRLLVGKAAEGREAVVALYEMAPAFQLDDPSLPPRVTRVFDTEAALPHAHAVTLAIRASEAERGVFDLSTSQPATTIDLACTAAKSASFTPIAVTRAGSAPGSSSSSGFRFRVPTLAAHRCYAVARDADALPLGRLGSAAHPVDVVVPPVAPPPPLYTRWWLWTTVAVVAGAAVVAGVAAASQKPAGPPTADLTLRPQRAVFAW
jgi:hypothetical protein